ncbi:hypothetical protein C8E01_106244 [Pontibacter virosus]|uniref:Uncharacterized protein n=2 Tax=Pontibacter virosus TaxID=1765052 RepID=A0A2U1AWY4_9BACT|nr:hypothetical protein C8E01_106244 [Pontibacter virosus]
MCLLCEKSFSQIEIHGVTTLVTDGIKSDSVNLSPNKEFENRIKLKPIDKSGNRVEIRFYEHETLSSTKDLKVLELKGDSWTGTQYKESNYPKIRIKKFELVAQNGFEELVKLLLQNNLTRLPSQEELSLKMKKYAMLNGKRVEKAIQTTDGQSYTVEFKIGDKYRVYIFHNPDTYSSFYDDVQELKDFVAIKNIFETELKRK